MNMLRTGPARAGALLAVALAVWAAPTARAQDDSSGRSWADIIAGTVGRITLAAEHGTLFYAFDRLTYPGEPVDLTAHVRWVKNMKDVPGVTIEFRRNGKSIGTAKTDADGNAYLPWKAPKAGAYEFTADIYAVPDPKYNEMLKVTPAPLMILARPKNTRFVVIDLDRTVVDSSFFRVLLGAAKPMAGAAAVIRELDKKRDIIYLTHRPDLLMVKSKSWLRTHGFPPGPLMVSRLSQAFGDSGEFKAGRLKTIRKMFPGADIGIGDKISDVQAYVANGMTAYLIPHYDRDDEEDCRDMAKTISRMHKDIQVVDTWAQVRDGILGGRKFPARTYARNLQRRADILRAEERRRDKDDDDDDDDDDD